MRVLTNTFHLSLVLVLVFIAFYANAENNVCTPWVVKDPGSYCLLSGGAEGRYYIRDCANEERICKWKPSGPMQDCEKTMLCSLEDPNTIVDCGPWRRVDGVKCIQPGTSVSAQKWSRSCVIGGQVETHCSRQPPPGAYY